MCSRIALITFLLYIAAPSFSQEEENEEDESRWERGMLFDLNFSQVAFQHWAAGGQNSISGTGMSNLYADLIEEKFSWKSSLDLAYGLLSRDKNPFIKSDDRLELRSRYGRRIDDNFSYSGRLELRSQFAPGYEFPEQDSIRISDFLSPGYAKADIGISYDPNEHFEMTLSPIASKMTIVRDDKLAARGAYGVEPGEKIRYEYGGNFSAAYRKTILPNVRLKSELGLFSNYFEKPGNLDVNFSMLLHMKVNSFISASISTDLIYDDDIHVPVDRNDDGVPDGRGPRLQFKEVLNIGISFAIGDREVEEKE